MRALVLCSALFFVSAHATAQQALLDVVSDARLSVSQHVALHIEGYTRAEADAETLTLHPDARTRQDRAETTLRYATNHAVGMCVYALVSGDLEGAEVDVALGAAAVERVARDGAPGVPQQATFDAGTGMQAVLVDVGQVVASRPVPITMRLRPGAEPRPRTITVRYVMAP